VKITADTNLLLRAVLEDDPQQAVLAQALISRAELMAVPVPVWCEMTWTLRRLYKRSVDDIADMLEALLHVNCVVTDRPAVEAGIQVLRQGGDFADGVIAWQGLAVGGTVLATFDKAAIGTLNAGGLKAAEPATLLSGS
jgi:predicted nucleic-acid-binding protein